MTPEEQAPEMTAEESAEGTPEKKITRRPQKSEKDGIPLRFGFDISGDADAEAPATEAAGEPAKKTTRTGRSTRASSTAKTSRAKKPASRTAKAAEAPEALAAPESAGSLLDSFDYTVPAADTASAAAGTADTISVQSLADLAAESAPAEAPAAEVPASPAMYSSADGEMIMLSSETQAAIDKDSMDLSGRFSAIMARDAALREAQMKAAELAPAGAQPAPAMPVEREEQVIAEFTAVAEPKAEAPEVGETPAAEAPVPEAPPATAATGRTDRRSQGQAPSRSRRVGRSQREQQAPVTMDIEQALTIGNEDTVAPSSFRGLVSNLQGGLAQGGSASRQPVRASKAQPAPKKAGGRQAQPQSRRGAERTERNDRNARAKRPEQQAAPAMHAFQESASDFFVVDSEQVPAQAQEPQASPAADDVAPAPVVRRAATDGKVVRVLVSWVGKVDISAALRHDSINPGPIRMLLEKTESFDRVIVLAKESQSTLEEFQKWVAPCVPEGGLDVHRTDVQDLTDHGAICTSVASVVDKAIKDFSLPEDGTGIVFLLSSGTPATHAVLMLLAVAKYRGITLMQTKLHGIGHESEAVKVELPGSVSEASADLDLSFQVLRSAVPATPSADATLQEKLDAAPVFRAYQEEVGGRSDRSGRRSAFGRRGAPMKQDTLSPASISSALGNVYTQMKRVAGLAIPVLLLGETGVGKSHLARHIHDWSGRRGRFMCLDCAGVTDKMLLGELFAMKAGEVPGVQRPTQGMLRQADNGTILLENVDALTPTQQGMLLRILPHDGSTEIEIQGPRSSTTLHVRVIASASPNLISDIRQGLFRSDLYYRLAGVCQVLPSVREYEPEERETLLRHFLIRLQERFRTTWNFSGDAWAALVDEAWPGNIREMGRMLQQICLLSEAGVTISREEVLSHLQRLRVTPLSALKAGVLPEAAPEQDPLPGMAPLAPAAVAESSAAPMGMDSMLSLSSVVPDGDDGAKGEVGAFSLGSSDRLDDYLEEVRNRNIAEAMSRAGGDRKEAARLLGVSYVQLSGWLRRMSAPAKGE